MVGEWNKPMNDARALIDAIRHELRAVEEEIRNHPYLDLPMDLGAVLDLRP
jgi:hypothetical protein